VRARHLCDLASSSKHPTVTMLLAALAADGEKHARLLADLARYLEPRDSVIATAISGRVNSKAHPVG
jgi:hypothetical protein